MAAAANTLVIACGALAKEIVALRQANGWSHMEVTCLPAELHNRPEKIPALVREKIQRFREWAAVQPGMVFRYAYGDSSGDQELLHAAGEAIWVKHETLQPAPLLFV